MDNLVRIDVGATTAKTVHNPFDSICVWDFRDFSDECFGGMPEGWYKQQYPFINYVILMTFTGGKGYNEWYTVDENGVAHMNFSKPIHILRNVLRQGVLPMIVIGNVPYALSDRPDTEGDSYGWGNRCLPGDYQKYYAYIYAFGEAIKAAFPPVVYSRFRFRVGTECDNFHWFVGSEQDYLQLYDYTVAALTDSLGSSVCIGPTNLETVDKFPHLLEHCATGTNYATGEVGTKCDFFSVSHYELGMPIVSYTSYREKALAAHRRAEAFPQLGLRDINVGEGQFLSDGMEPPHRLHMAQDNTAYGASWHAQNFADSLKYDVAYFANWAYCCDYKRLQEPLLKPPAYFAALLCSRLAGSHLIDCTMKGVPEDTAVGAVAARSPARDTVYVLCYHHRLPRDGADLEFTVTLNGVPASKAVEFFPVDREHNNFTTRWMAESAELERVESATDFDTLGSVVETEIFETLSGDNLDFWLRKKTQYAADNHLHAFPVHTEGGETLTLRFPMPHHSMALAVIHL